ncbi:MAG TPA: flagellar hook-basal body complex protein FliE [Methylocella sp.]|nr:flagellar hook-basal body complex protein FliE [Methylocella sp.]
MIPALSSLSLLPGALSLPQAAGAAAQAAAAAGGSGGAFDHMLDQISAAIDNLKAGEAAAISGLEGRLPVQTVVESVMMAERSLQTAVAIRDKLVSAYQTISQMAI